jgi:hypothetical protein
MHSNKISYYYNVSPGPYRSSLLAEPDYADSLWKEKSLTGTGSYLFHQLGWTSLLQ